MYCGYSKDTIKDSLTLLLTESDTRPFLFRTRFERTMLRTIKYAEAENNYELCDLAKKALFKMKEIVDKSNTTADGQLRSFILLEEDISQLINYI